MLVFFAFLIDEEKHGDVAIPFDNTVPIFETLVGAEMRRITVDAQSQALRPCATKDHAGQHDASAKIHAQGRLAAAYKALH